MHREKCENEVERLQRFLSLNSEKVLAAGVLVFFILAIIYFFETGRLPSRLYRALVLVSAPVLVLLAVKSFQGGKRKADSRFYVFLLLAISLLSFFSFDFSSLRERKKYDTTVMESIIRYAINHPDNVYLSNIVASARIDPFTTYPEAKPTNLISAIGFNVHSPIYMRQLRLNGFDKASQAILLDERVYHATMGLEDALTTYYSSQYPEYEFVLAERIDGGVYIYKLVRSESLL